MTTLSFHAKADCLVRVPGVIEIIGQAPHYVGRRLSRLSNGSFAYPAVDRPYQTEENSDVGRRLRKLASRDGSLWPADKETADACGVKFVPVEFANGEWVPKKTSYLKSKAD
jgi:hypothetical protein